MLQMKPRSGFWNKWSEKCTVVGWRDLRRHRKKEENGKYVSRCNASDSTIQSEMVDFSGSC